MPSLKVWVVVKYRTST